MTDIVVFVVVYNCSLENSKTLQTLNPQLVSRVFVADNSTIENENEQLAKDKGYRYLSMQGNVGLSRAYNKLLDQLYAEIQNRDTIICLFDDDTKLTDDYFLKLGEAFCEHSEYQIYVPYVYDQVGLLSPCGIKGAITFRFHNEKEIASEGISAINSGMAIRMECYESYRYDERLFLDYVDHAFLKDITNHSKANIYIFDTQLFQNFSATEHKPLRTSLKRFRIFSEDINNYCRKYRVSPLQKMMILSKRLTHIYADAVIRKLTSREEQNG
ncbi:MAG: glycosyltransferase [Anaerofustis sp.]